MSFDRHPGAAITGRPVPMINSNQDRVWIMKHYYGIEEVILAEFNEKMMHQPWDEFVEDYLVGELGAVCVITGDDNRFGARGQGNPERLRQKCAELGIGCKIIGMVEVDGVQVHSTKIRELLQAGEMEQVDRLLGHPHILTHRVEKGKKLGSALGFPTVNLAFAPGGDRPRPTASTPPGSTSVTRWRTPSPTSECAPRCRMTTTSPWRGLFWTTTVTSTARRCAWSSTSTCARSGSSPTSRP